MHGLLSCFGQPLGPVSGDPAEAFKDVFLRYSDNGLMGTDQLRRFLMEVQGDELEGVGSQDLGFKCFQGGGLDLDAFFRYLSSDDNPPLDPSLGVHQDMNAPLSHYFIYTGHNSYLTGNQLSSESSDVPIIKALQRGVRVIELDLWPNSSKTDAEVRHGRTLTTPVVLSKCLKSIKEHAFDVSPYPVIITLEDHLTSNLQAKVAEMLKETFGDLLFYPSTEFLDEFPSPEDLKYRVLISTKTPKELLESKSINENYRELQKETKEVEHYHSEHYQKEEEHDANNQSPNHPIAHEYKHLISIASRKGKGELINWLKGNVNKVTRLSLNELLFEKLVASHGPELIRFTQKNILRIYPKGTRITSSNYNPLPGLMYGAQMVALNMQGYGRSLWLMHGFFRANGGCGYIKKPDFLLKTCPHSMVFDPLATSPVKKTMKIKVYHGNGWLWDSKKTHFSLYSPPVFYTKVRNIRFLYELIITFHI
ncbi:phosphoinositide phospholipase C 2-like isoform X1 [Asparagus officinalis]|uniref:phosphoinositide phospholipase C 2-like isoform X1 n=2 Tax=Asparagus officinalis TaxID=4686 RepID=UPI00098E1B65|nr:phosphoinositide phospholipase C 2-like isoform X1 [Asparagus officinalis]